MIAPSNPSFEDRLLIETFGYRPKSRLRAPAVPGVPGVQLPLCLFIHRVDVLSIRMLYSVARMSRQIQ